MNLLKHTIVYTKAKSFIGDAVTACQDIYWKKNGKKSKFSHTGFVGSDGLFYESIITMKVINAPLKIWKWTPNIPQLKYTSGVKISKLWKRYKNIDKEYDTVGLQIGIKISDKSWELATAFAKTLANAKYRYGTLELIGTLWTLLKWKYYNRTKKYTKAKALLKKDNPLDKKSAGYCIAFVAECLRAAGVKYLDINPSVATVDHGWHSKIKHTKRMIKE